MLRSIALLCAASMVLVTVPAFAASKNSAKSYAPGQRMAADRCGYGPGASDCAPGHLKKSDESAKKYAPGHREMKDTRRVR
jgi:hypothetical protein